MDNLKIDASTKATNVNLVRFSFLYTMYNLLILAYKKCLYVLWLVGCAISMASLMPSAFNLCSLLRKTRVLLMQYLAFRRAMQLVL
jgi:hypothetical protein